MGGAWTTWRADRVKIGPLASVSVTDAGEPLAPGEVRAERRRVLVGTGNGVVELGQVQPHGKKTMDADAWARGVRPGTGERFDG